MCEMIDEQVATLLVIVIVILVILVIMVVIRLHNEGAGGAWCPREPVSREKDQQWIQVITMITMMVMIRLMVMMFLMLMVMTR